MTDRNSRVKERETNRSIRNSPLIPLREKRSEKYENKGENHDCRSQEMPYEAGRAWYHTYTEHRRSELAGTAAAAAPYLSPLPISISLSLSPFHQPRGSHAKSDEL